MLKRNLYRLLLILVVLIGLGISFGEPRSAPVRPQPAVIIETLDPSLDRFAAAWKKEIGRRFDSAVGVLVHGGDFVEGQWIIGSRPGSGHVEPVNAVLDRIQEKYPGRIIVLLACNTGHLKLSGRPGVFYAMAPVWCVPDRSMAGFDLTALYETFDYGDVSVLDVFGDRWVSEPDNVGNVFEFVEAR